VRPDRGVRTFADLKGKRIATTTKTTAHIFLDRALRANSVDPSQVDVVNGSMSASVASFINGDVPAVALWVPFNISVREKVPDAVKLVDASAYYPQSAVVGGWVARNDFYDANKDVLARIIRGWADANDFMVRNSAAAAEALQKTHYPQARIADVSEALKAQKMFSSRESKRLYSDGSVVKWLQQVSDFFMADAGATKLIRRASISIRRSISAPSPECAGARQPSSRASDERSQQKLKWLARRWPQPDVPRSRTACRLVLRMKLFPVHAIFLNERVDAPPGFLVEDPT